MSTLSIVCYRPKSGKEDELLQLTREHVPILRAQGLATDRSVVAMRAADGTIVEVFEWESGGIERAHTNPEVAKLWGRYNEACEFVPFASLPEAQQLFAGFEPISLD